MNIVELVVDKDYCAGCGVCAAVCPTNNLTMSWSNKGELVPSAGGDCKQNCSLCQTVCPFYDHDVNQTDIARKLFSSTLTIKHYDPVGYYLSTYIGYVTDTEKRIHSASGGMATWFLEQLFYEGIVDGVVLVGASTTDDRMFDFRIATSPDEIRKCSGSCYYPVEISKVLKAIIKEKYNKRYAVITLPCGAYALRLAMRRIPLLRRRIVLIASLTCGQLQNRFCTELLAVESGIGVNKLKKMDFRRKSDNQPAINYMQVPIDINGNEGLAHPNQGLPMYLWTYRYFTLNACAFCDDIFGETADVTFMDAWLPDYMNDYRGTSLVVARSVLAKQLLEKGVNSKACYLKPIEVEQIAASQAGVIYKKRSLLAGRLYYMKKQGTWFPKKRVSPSYPIYLQNRKFIRLTENIQNISKVTWVKHRNSFTTEDFWQDMREMDNQIKQYEKRLRLRAQIGRLYRAVLKTKAGFSKPPGGLSK